MTLTLQSARETVLDHLDDDNTRWSTFQTDRALQLALNQCLDDYQAAGGDRFDIVENLSSVQGLIDMSAKNVINVKGMSLIVGQRRFPLAKRPVEQREVVDLSDRQVQVRYARSYTIPTVTAHQLVGIGITPANSWDSFDHWICLRAAMFMSTKDQEQRPDLKEQADLLAGTILTLPKIPSARPFPGPPRWYSSLVTYTWNQSSKSLFLCRQF